MSAVIPDDTFAFDRGAQLHRVILLIQYAVPLDLKFNVQNIHSICM